MQHNYWNFEHCKNSKNNQGAYKNSKDEVKMQSTAVISNKVEKMTNKQINRDVDFAST